MTSALALENQALAEELYALLRSLDPARWKEELEPAMRARLHEIRDRMQQLLEEREWSDSEINFDLLRERLQALRQVIQDAEPQTARSAQWDEFRKEMLPAYEAFAASLKLQSIHVPSLRPTNYTRNIFHVMSGVTVLMVFHHTFSQEVIVWIAGIAAMCAWSMEISRRFSTKINDFLMKLFGHVAHPHEQYRVNSATWYTTALLVIASLASPLACSLAIIVLGVSDPSAAIVGRRFGKRQIVAGRTLEGSAAFVLAGVLASFLVMSIYYPEVRGLDMLWIALGGAVPGAVVEMISERVDDNFSIPVTVAAGVMGASFLIGL